MRIDTLSIDTLVVGALVLLAMVGISVYGWVTLPPDARVPVHRGPGGWGNWQPKAWALITYPVGGAVVFAIVLTATTRGKSGKRPSRSSRRWRSSRSSSLSTSLSWPRSETPVDD